MQLIHVNRLEIGYNPLIAPLRLKGTQRYRKISFDDIPPLHVTVENSQLKTGM